MFRISGILVVAPALGRMEGRVSKKIGRPAMTEQEIQRGLELLGMTGNNMPHPPLETIVPPAILETVEPIYLIRLSNNTGGGKPHKD